MAHSDDSSSSCSSVRATLERLRASQNVALLPSKPPDQDEDDSEGQEVLLALARLRRSQSSRHVDHDDTASKSTASSSDHIELAERLKALTMSQKTFSLSLQSQKAWASYRKADVDFNGENEDEESMAHSTTPVSEGFAPSSTGIYFYQDDVNGLPKIDPHNVAPEDLVLADPDRWSYLTDAFESLRHHQWLTHDCVDRFLLQHWCKLGKDASVYWIPIEMVNICKFSNAIEDGEKTQFRDLLLLPPEPLGMRPVVFAVHDNTTRHYFAVAFDYERQSAYVWGRLFGSTQAGLELHKTPEKWGGRILWGRFAALCGWHVAEGPVSWRGRNWYQNGKDCGATVSSILFRFLRKGLPLSSDQWPELPQIECAHETRLQMLKAILAGVTESYHVWLTVKDIDHGARWSQPLEAGLERMEKGLHPFHLHIEEGLVAQRRACDRCKSRSSKSKRIDSTAEEEIPTEEGEAVEAVEVAPPLAPLTPMPGDVPYPGALSSAAKKASKLLSSARCRYTMPMRAPKINPLAPLKPVPFKLLRRELRIGFDEYATGPSLEKHKEMMNEYGQIPSNPLPWEYRPTERSLSELWRDWGYRTEPEFLLMFRDDTPQAVEEHLLPPEWDCPSSPEEEPPDCVRMGMADMLAYAPDQGSDRSINAFIAGVREDNDLIIFDPALDAKPVSAKNFSYTTDIDSVIINAHTLHVRGPVEVDVLPFCGKEPPMPKSNHTFAEILMPRSQAEIDEDPARRKSWYSNRISIASLPHTFFGKIGVFNIMIVFPRMKHMNPISRRSSTLLPWEMHAKFLSEVVHTAIIGIEDKEMLAYKDYNINEWYWKASTSSRFSGSRKSVTVTRFMALQQMMRDIITLRTENNGEDLSMFASFFFVMEAKGIKHQTTSVVGKGMPDPYTLLCQNISYLDFDKLQERENGQLLMDIGLGFHPNPPDGEPVVCLWDLEHVIASYKSAGMMAPNVHHLNTMNRYGGCQAEMKQDYAGLVQLCFRSTYGQHYEPVRRVRGGYITMCEDRDAYHTSAKFFSSTNDYSRQLKSAGKKDHSYGAREELRGSGKAICTVLQAIDLLMSKYIEAQPLICVPAKTFFEFQARRMLDLQETQRRLSKRRPSNYGTTTTLLAHLMRSVCHAPTATLPHLKRALTDLNYSQVCKRFGMFFLHGLQLERGFVDGIHPSDDEECEKYYNKDKKRYWKRVGKHIKRPLLNPTVDLALYPLGPKPTWEEWKAGISQNPAQLVNTFFYDETWGANLEEQAAGSFTRFTREYLTTLRDDALRGGAPRIDNLKDSMQVWTVETMSETVVSSGFQPSNHSLSGAFQGARHISFRDQMSHFFPNSSQDLSESAYAPFAQYGYLKRYHRLQLTSQDEGAALEASLGDIFERLQILPVVNPGKLLWKTSKEDGILFWANSRYFKLQEIGPKRRFVQRERGPKVKAPMKDIIRSLKRLNSDTIPDIAILARENRERAQNENAKRQNSKNVARRSAKKNRARKPPPPRARGTTQRKAAAGSDDSDGEEAINRPLAAGGEDDDDEGVGATQRRDESERIDAPRWTVLRVRSESDSGNDASGYESALGDNAYNLEGENTDCDSEESE